MSLHSLFESVKNETDAIAQHTMQRLHALLVVSPDGSVLFATARAEHWMRDFFAAVSPLNRLPEALTRWFNGASGTGSTFVLERGGRKLSLCVLCHEPESICLVLEQNAERDRTVSPRPLLTERQREVLSWVAHGKTNAEVGEILGLRTRTVGKYLERIFPKLGVENRTAAARSLWSAPAERSGDAAFRCRSFTGEDL